MVYPPLSSWHSNVLPPSEPLKVNLALLLLVSKSGPLSIVVTPMAGAINNNTINNTRPVFLQIIKLKSTFDYLNYSLGLYNLVIIIIIILIIRTLQSICFSYSFDQGSFLFHLYIDLNN